MDVDGIADELYDRLSEGRECFPDHVVGTSPGAGADFAFKLDSNFQWRLRALRLLLATSAVAGTRTPILDFVDPDGKAWFRFIGGGSQASSPGDEYVWTAGRSTGGGEQLVSGAYLWTTEIADVWLPRGWAWQVNIDGIDGADQISGVRMYVEKRRHRD